MTTSTNQLGWVLLGAVMLGGLVWIVMELVASDNVMSVGGWVALLFGIIGTVSMAGALMWLLFESDRRGYDR
jgi:hypothetical protein